MAPAVRSIAITSCFAHHASFNGYRQILNYTKPDATFGTDERRRNRTDYWGDRYPWVHEVRAWRRHRRCPVDVLHILYGEWYLYASPWLFGRTPIVATFHQPPDKLNRLLEWGPRTGRIMQLVHNLTRTRFAHLSRAIVLTEEQKNVLKRVVPSELIHVIPLGTAANQLIAAFASFETAMHPNMVLTVGEWLRDWDFYFTLVRNCRQVAPDLEFVLINRKLPEKWHRDAHALPNLEWHDDASDDQLLRYYSKASAFLLPLTEATGNNAVNEAMAAGLPIVSTVSIDVVAPNEFRRVAGRNQSAVLSAIREVQSISGSQRQTLRHECHQLLATRDWSATAKETMAVYAVACADARGRH